MRTTLLEPESVHQDARRTITQLFTADIKQVNVYEAKANVTLGDHYHKNTIEYFYILDGEVVANGKYCTAGDLFVYYPETKHTIVCRTDCRFMTFLTLPYDERNPDIWKE